MRTLHNNLTQNELRVFKAIFESGPVSRVKIANGLNLTRAAVTRIVQQLMQKKLILEVGKGNSKNGPGRREVLLTVNPEAGFILSIHFALRYATYGLVNFNGKIIHKSKQKYANAASPEEAIAQTLDSVEAYITEHDIAMDGILGIGVALPGIVNHESGRVIEQTISGWEGFAIKDFIQKRMTCPVIVDNDVKTLTLGEFHFGTGWHIRNMVCLWLEDGIGSGIIHDGRLIRGVTSSAGEIGFNEFLLSKPASKTILINGSPRCWGDIISFSNILTSIQRGLDEGWQSQLSQEASIDDFVESVEANDPLGIYLFRLIGELVGIVSCNLIYTFNPQVLLLSGPLFRKIPQLSDEVRHHLNAGILRLPIEAVELRTSILGEDSVTVGCGALMLEHLFKGTENASMLSIG